MKRIMFVCLGNICRSPLAHAVFADIVEKSKVAHRYHVDSSGIIGHHAGERSDPRMLVTANAHGINITHRAKQLTRKHLDEFHMIVCMDDENKAGALRIVEDPTQEAKICMLRDFDPKGPGIVPDPYYGGDQGFETVFDIVSRSCTALFEKLEA
jgi:protein-tyrosine-phosphatase